MTDSWRGFDSAGGVERVDGGWEYACDGLPWLMGCPSRITVQRRWVTVGKKKHGWLVCYGLEPKTPDTRLDDPDGWVPDEDVVLTFCPGCATVLAEQGAS